MNRKTWAIVLAVMAPVGCSLIQSDQHPEPILPRSGTRGPILAPKRCTLKLAIVPRPVNDPAINEVLWGAADEQVVAPEVRRTLESNGLRVGLIVGDLPTEVQALLDAPPPRRIDPLLIDLPDGDSTLLNLATADPPPQASVLLNRDGKAVGKVYEDPRGHFRLIAAQEGPTGIALRLVPEIHHGPIRRQIGTDANADEFAPQQFILKDGQQEEILRELATSLTVEPGQVLVVGCRPALPHSVGDFLLTEPEPHSDRLLQKVLLFWATRSGSGADDVAPLEPPKDLEPVDPSDLPGRPAGPGPARPG